MSDCYEIGENLGNYSPYPRVKLKSRNLVESSRFPAQEVSIVVTDFFYDQVNLASRDCSYLRRLQEAGTMEYFRLFEVCRVDTEGSVTTIDINGVGVF
jgi:hypothetical protein